MCCRMLQCVDIYWASRLSIKNSHLAEACAAALELQVIFRTSATNYRALLQKTTYEDKASYDSTPPYSELIFENSAANATPTPAAQASARCEFLIESLLAQ